MSEGERTPAKGRCQLMLDDAAEELLEAASAAMIEKLLEMLATGHGFLRSVLSDVGREAVSQT